MVSVRRLVEHGGLDTMSAVADESAAAVTSTARHDDTVAARLLAALPAPCAVYSAESGQLRYANEAFRNMFGNGTSIATQSVFEARFQRYGQSDSSRPDDATTWQYDAFEPASNNWFAMQWSTFDWSDAKRHEMVMVANTSARQAAVRDQVHERDKLLFTSRMMSVGEMASTIAHELNQPLAAIMNYLTVGARLLESPDQIGDARSAVDMARTQAEHASSVIRHLREFVRAREPSRSAHRIDEIMERVLTLTELDVKQSLVHLSHGCDDDLPDVLVDDVMIEQVLLNLIRNAIGAMREVHPMHRRIHVAAYLNLDDDLQVSVTDSGCGVTKEQELRLFEPLYTTKPDGLGIGLAICRSILEYHGGRLWFERDANDQTVFSLTLPTASSEGETDE